MKKMEGMTKTEEIKQHILCILQTEITPEGKNSCEAGGCDCEGYENAVDEITSKFYIVEKEGLEEKLTKIILRSIY
jgi:hypothetical protein